MRLVIDIVFQPIAVFKVGEDYRVLHGVFLFLFPAAKDLKLSVSTVRINDREIRLNIQIGCGYTEIVVKVAVYREENCVPGIGIKLIAR